MHQNYYDHDKNEPSYKRYISNIAYRFKFDVIFEDEQVLKVENGINTFVLASTEDAPRNTLCYKAWLKLTEEYGYSGDK